MKPKKKDNSLTIAFGIGIYVLIVLIVCHLGIVTLEFPELSSFELLTRAMERFETSPFDIFPISLTTWKMVGTLTVGYILFSLYLYVENERNHRDAVGIESGSASWNNDINKYNKKYSDPPKSKKNDGYKNMILTKDVRLNMNTRQTRRNNNVLVVGGSGSGKSRYLVKPNLLQANASFVVTDPSGELLESCGKFLEEQGYEIKVFNLVQMVHSHCYNPFDYIRDDLGVSILINCLIQNTNPVGNKGGGDFWEKCENALLQALIFYLIKYRPKEEHNFTNVMKLLRAAEVDENKPNAKSKLDKLFDEVAEKDPHGIALKQYLTFKMGAGKTLKSILISTSVRLTVFNLKEIESLTCKDTLDLRSLGDRKQALFVVIPAADNTFNFLVSMMYTQLFESLYYHAENECNYKVLTTKNEVLCLRGKEADAKQIASNCNDITMHYDSNFYSLLDKEGNTLARFYSKNKAEKLLQDVKKGLHVKYNGKVLPSHVRFMLDEFANIGNIPEFDKKLATMRKYELSCTIILQNLAQLKEMYDKKWEGLVGNCDSFILLGGKEFSTSEAISKELGKATIVVRNNSRSRGKSGSSSHSFNRSARELMTPDEIIQMQDDECILIIRGVRPFFGKKFEYTKHKNYSHTGDSDPSNIYNYKEFINNQIIHKSLEDAIVSIQKEEAEIVKNAIEKGKEEELISTPSVLDDNALKSISDTQKDITETVELINLNEDSDEVEEWDFSAN